MQKSSLFLLENTAWRSRHLRDLCHADRNKDMMGKMDGCENFTLENIDQVKKELFHLANFELPLLDKYTNPLQLILWPLL